MFGNKTGKALIALLLGSVGALATEEKAEPSTPAEVIEAGARLIAADVVELRLIERKEASGRASVLRWNVADLAGSEAAVAVRLQVRVDGAEVPVLNVGARRHVVRAPRLVRDLQVESALYLRLGRQVPDGARVDIRNPDGKLWEQRTRFDCVADPLRTSPAVHVNQEGYLPAAPKRARVGFYLGSLGELPVAANTFSIVDEQGKRVFRGKLRLHPERGFKYEPQPYQQVYEAEFTDLREPGVYRVTVPGLGASLRFRIDDGIAMDFARAYALGIYHQRCGTGNAMPYTRFTHAACHLAPAYVPDGSAQFAATWKNFDRLTQSGGSAAAERAGMPELLYPYVRTGRVNVSGGHHDAGDYGKYTTNSASFVHTLVFAVDSIRGAAELDNLGLPESGNGVPDLLDEAKWEADFLVRMQDSDGGFYFLVHPRDRAYEQDVMPDHGDPQVVWPKNTAATAAAVAALAQAGSSPAMKRAFPDAAERYAEAALRGWEFLEAAHARLGEQKAYRRLTHYGDDYSDRDELAWAACELFLATGVDRFRGEVARRLDPASPDTRRWGWWRMNECWGNAIRSYAFGVSSGRLPKSKMDAALLAKCVAEIAAAAEDAADWSDHCSYGTSLPDPTKRMRSGGWYFSLDRAFDLAVAAQLDDEPGRAARARLLRAYVANLDFEGGCNPRDVCFVTGLGHRFPHELVHQVAQNDRRTLPPSGLPVGNLTTGMPFLDLYKKELGALSFPSDGAERAPYPYYDRWADAYNVTGEFVIVNQARALAGLAWLAAGTEAAKRPWKPPPGEIEHRDTGEGTEYSLVVPAGMDASEATITWEGAGGIVDGPQLFIKRGRHADWIEAEARWPDGRRIVAERDE